MEFFKQRDTALLDVDVFVRCTWTAGYAEPEVNKGLRAISYVKRKQGGKRIGRLTGNFTNIDGVYWVEAWPENCNRLSRLWFRANDILPDLFLSQPEPAVDNEPPKKINWLWWLTAGLMALKGF